MSYCPHALNAQMAEANARFSRELAVISRLAGEDGMAAVYSRKAAEADARAAEYRTRLSPQAQEAAQ